ncbi:alpha/beta hydrolase [Nocardia sp. NBC_00565]|uniref:alpha/beta fold hydrolase n=1 Tax=Nocardia sp. NBC_00565 TaxID=2975993 RepID=UPI002E817DD1|nr:alpha/beta hydrolase [Nocardia sp. NBC_00565]WUC02284.1 alpha/beta hydrolase [Nocardia sp. NBC_00565]
MIEATKISTDSGTFDVLTSGEPGGREVMLLHGFPESAIEWEFQLTALGGGGCYAVAPDQRGYSPGARPEQVADYRVEELVSDVAAIADQLDWQRFDLIGHDWGAYVAWAAAATMPERIRSLTAVSLPHPAAFLRAMTEDEDQAQRSQYFNLLRRPRVAERVLLADNASGLRQIFDWKIPEDRIDDYIYRLTQPEALTAALNWYRAMHLAEPTGPIQVPTLYVWSTEDTTVGSTAALATAAHVTAPYRFEMLEDISHWIPEQAPEALTRLIMEHLLTHRT